ncbi:MAG: nucleotide exchange factor GrpE [Candidatus Velthaea sp.]|jgi:molecular chaperone GrpE
MNDDVNATVSSDTAASGAATATADNPAAELAAAKAKADENYNKFLYAMADFENYKKRIERQLAEISLAGKRSVLLKLLPVLDNLERALAYDTENEGLKGGLLATHRAFENVLASEHVKTVSLKGQLFDPKLAEGIGTQPAPDGVADDTVLEEALKLYLIGDDVLRPAQVIVAKAP